MTEKALQKAALHTPLPLTIVCGVPGTTAEAPESNVQLARNTLVKGAAAWVAVGGALPLPLPLPVGVLEGEPMGLGLGVGVLEGGAQSRMATKPAAGATTGVVVPAPMKVALTAATPAVEFTKEEPPPPAPPQPGAGHTAAA